MGAKFSLESTDLGESGADEPAVFIPVSGHTGEREGKGRGMWIRDFTLHSIQSLVVFLLNVNEPVVNTKTLSYRKMILECFPIVYLHFPRTPTHGEVGE